MVYNAVEPAGPPWVSNHTESKLLDVQIVDSNTVTSMTYFRPGSVTWMNLRHADAPSTAAASYSWLSIAFRPARKLMVKKGIPFQVFTITTDAIARSGSASQVVGHCG